MGEEELLAELAALRAAARAVVEANDTEGGAIEEARYSAGKEAADALKRALDDPRAVRG